MSLQSNFHMVPQSFRLTAAVPLSALRERLAVTITTWWWRITLRRRLAEMDARSLRELGISPAAAAYESGRSFWRRLGCLR